MDGSRILIFMNTKEGCDQLQQHSCMQKYVKDANYVINYDFQEYIHRIGRTGKAGQKELLNINQLDHGGFQDCGMGYGGGSKLYFVGNISMYD
ncbi:dead-box atp-dependent rna helicase 20 [Quercus suber]|uniref:Dead-box atp-dependent rna helicase 20 n=1 Tax=Quercus suber TaxID=58331 RepID=A0AAW0LJF0_QUESU